MNRTPLTRRTPIKRSPIKRKAAHPRVKRTDADLWKQYGLTKPAKPRFKGLAGILWYAMSRYVRKFEFLTYGGECVDGCGRKVERWEDADCGHFRASSRGFCTRFTRENLGLQTKYCNNPVWSPDSSYGFGKTIDARYGSGTAERLTQMSRMTCQEYTDAEYDREIKKYLNKFAELSALEG